MWTILRATLFEAVLTQQAFQPITIVNLSYIRRVKVA
jgi:hypothetical protein